MAEKNNTVKPLLGIDEVSKAQLEFNKALFELGLELIAGYKAERYRENDKVLEAIIKIFEVQPQNIWRE